MEDNSMCYVRKDNCMSIVIAVGRCVNGRVVFTKIRKVVDIHEEHQSFGITKSR